MVKSMRLNSNSALDLLVGAKRSVPNKKRTKPQNSFLIKKKYPEKVLQSLMSCFKLITTETNIVDLKTRIARISLIQTFGAPSCWCWSPSPE